MGSAVGQAVGTAAGWGIVALGCLFLAVLLSYWLRRFFGSFLTDNRARPQNREPRTGYRR